MENDEGDTKKTTGNNLPSNCDISKPIWVRYPCLQIDAINRRLLDYNAYIVCGCGPILYLIFHLL